MVEQSNPLESPRGCNFVLNMLVGLFLGGCIFLLLIFLHLVLHRGIWSALLAGLLGTIIYWVLVLPQWWFGRRLGASRPRKKVSVTTWTGPLDIRRQSIGIALLSSLGIALGVGLYALPDQQPIFVLLGAALGLLLCICLFALGLWILAIFLARGDRRNVFIVTSDDPSTKEKEPDEGNS